ncbi:MAG: hypothetical protein PHX01_02745 [Clostridia bacterium]|nr:hypothetical protein [Clostridia bacterium]
MRKFFRKKGWKVFFVLLAFCAVFFITYTLNDLYIKQNVQTVRVATVTKKIPPYTLVTKEQVTMLPLPVSVVPEDAVLNVEEFFQGQKYYTNELGLGAGDLLRREKLSADNTSPLGKLTRLSDDQTMLVAINTNLVQSCANLVVPGTLVHAIVYIKAKGMGEEDVVISFAEDPGLANLLVVDKKNANSAVVEEEGREAIPAVVVFKLHQNQQNVAKALVKYNETGTVYLLPVGFQGDVFLGLAAQK